MGCVGGSGEHLGPGAVTGLRQGSPCCRRGRQPRSLGAAGGVRTVCARVPPVCSRGVRKRGAWPRPCPCTRSTAGGRRGPAPGPARPGSGRRHLLSPAGPQARLPSTCYSARCVSIHLPYDAGVRDRMSRPPARTLKWIPQCDGLWGGMGTESGHVGGGFVGGSAPPGKRLGGKLAPGSAARPVGTQLAQTSAIGRGPHPTPTGQRPALGPPASRLRDSMCVAEAQVCDPGYGSPRGPRRWPRSCREEHAGFRIGRIPEAEMR